MILGVSSYVTSAGLKAITSAGSLGPYFAIKYFVPIYNFRIDKTICLGYTSATSAQSISALNLVSATDSNLNNTFEKIYNGQSYKLSNNKNVVYYDVGVGGINNGGTSNLTGSRQSIPTNTNTLNNMPLSRIVSGTSVSTNTSGAFTVTSTNDVSALAFNPLSAATPPISAFYRVTSYSPKSTGITSASGSFKCKIPAGTGSFKFNGLALYGTKVDNHGFDDNGLGVSSFNFKPVLIGVALFDEVQTKQDGVGGINDFEIKVDLGFDWTTLNTSGATPVYIETNYWSKMPISSTTSADGISYDGDVVLSSSAVPGSWTPRAKLTITDKTKQQLRLNQDELHFVDFQVKRYGLNDTSATGSDNDLTVLSIDSACPDDSIIQMGWKTSATAIQSVAIGCNAVAYGYGNGGPRAYENNDTKTNGGYTTSIGVDTSAGGFASMAIGQGTLADGYGCFAGGYLSVSVNDNPGNYTPLENNGFNFAFGYMTSAISDGNSCNSDSSYLGIGDQSVYSKGSNISLGQQSISKGAHSISMGLMTSAIGNGAISLGRINHSDGCYASTIGYKNYSKGYGSIAMGANSKANGTNNNSQGAAFAIGQSVSALGTHSVSIGSGALADGLGSISIGSYTTGSDTSYNTSTGIYAVAIGQSSAIGNFSQAYGFGNKSTGSGSISIGSKNIANYQGAVAIGSNNRSENSSSVAMGNAVSALGPSSFAINQSTLAQGSNSFAGGWSTSALGGNSIAFGVQNMSNGTCSISLGYKGKADGDNSISIGRECTSVGDGSVSIGNYASSLGIKSFSFGNGCNVIGNNSIAIGSNILLNGDNKIVIGSNIGTEPISAIDILSTNIHIGNSNTDNITIEGKNVYIKGWSPYNQIRVTLFSEQGSWSTGSGNPSQAVYWISIDKFDPIKQIYTNTADMRIIRPVGSSPVKDMNHFRGVNKEPTSYTRFAVWVNPKNGTIELYDINETPSTTKSEELYYISDSGNLQTDGYDSAKLYLNNTICSLVVDIRNNVHFIGSVHIYTTGGKYYTNSTLYSNVDMTNTCALMGSAHCYGSDGYTGGWSIITINSVPFIKLHSSDSKDDIGASTLIHRYWGWSA